MSDAASQLQPSPNGKESGAVPSDSAEGDPRRWVILGILCLSLILIVASVSSLNVAIPSIVRALAASQTEQLWILDAYALIFAGVLLPAGAIGDRYGRKGALLVGLLIFGGAAVVATIADSPAQLIMLRGVMGVGAAFIMPATLSIITVVFPPQERGKAIAIWAGFAGAGGALGPLASGLLLDHYWWGSVFFVNVPLVALAFLAIAVIVPTSRDPETRPLDPIGALLSIAGLGSLVFGIIQGPEQGWLSGVTIGAFVAAAVFLIGFVRYELAARHPMLDPRLFKIRRFALGSLTITAAFAAMFGMFYLATMYFQFVQEHSPLAAAVRLLPFPITMLLVAPRGPKAVERFGAANVVSVGLLIQAVGFVAASFLGVDTPYVMAAGTFVTIAVGLALLMPPSTEAIVSSLPPSKAGVGSAVNDTTREVGGAIGIALLGSLMSTRYRSGVGDVVDQAQANGLPQEAGERIHDSIAGVGQARQVATELNLPDVVFQQLDGVAEVAKDAFTQGMTVAFLAAAGIGFVTSIVVRWFYPRGADEPALGGDLVEEPAQGTTEAEVPSTP